jgi:hypothetical protein
VFDYVIVVFAIVVLNVAYYSDFLFSNKVVLTVIYIYKTTIHIFNR